MGPIDIAPVLEREGTVFLSTDAGGFLFVPCGGDVYEVHVQFLPEGRASVFRLAHAAAWWMFTRTPAIAVSTFVTNDNARARRLTLAMGFKVLGPKTVNGYEGTGYILTIKDWLCQQQQ